MKILFLFPDLNFNSSFKPIINIANYLSNENNKIYIAVQGEVNDTTKEKFCDSVVFIVRRNTQSKLSWANELIRMDFDCFIGVQAHNAYWLAIAKMLSLKPKKIISWEHSSPITSIKNEYRLTWPVWLALRFILSHSTDAFFCVSEGAVSQMKKLVRFSENKVFYTPNLIFKTSDLNPTSSRTDSSTINIVSVGRLSKEKGLVLALQALSQFRNLDFIYRIVGEGPCYEQLNDYVNNTSSLKKKVKFLGRRDDVISIMASSDLILLPSYFEGLPTVLVEACIANTPIIAADCETGPSEIVKNGVNGYLFEVGSYNDLYRKIKLWLETRNSIKNDISYISDYNESAGVKFLDNIKKVIS